MKVLDLFAGLKGWSQAFEDRGHKVVTVELDAGFMPTFDWDIFEVEPEDLDWFKPDIILASPPCQCFSVATIGRNWNPGYVPKTEEAAKAIRLVEKTLSLIEALDPPLWVMENPRAMLRKMPIMAKYPRTTVSYCQYGENIMKPTDLWGKWPMGFVPRLCGPGQSCHESAPRGSATGTQGLKGPAARGKIPYGLSLEMCLAAEKSLDSPIATAYTKEVSN